MREFPPPADLYGRHALDRDIVPTIRQAVARVVLLIETDHTATGRGAHRTQGEAA